MNLIPFLKSLFLEHSETPASEVLAQTIPVQEVPKVEDKPTEVKEVTVGTDVWKFRIVTKTNIYTKKSHFNVYIGDHSVLSRGACCYAAREVDLAEDYLRFPDEASVNNAIDNFLRVTYSSENKLQTTDVKEIRKTV